MRREFYHTKPQLHHGRMVHLYKAYFHDYGIHVTGVEKSRVCKELFVQPGIFEVAYQFLVEETLTKFNNKNLDRLKGL